MEDGTGEDFYRISHFVKSSPLPLQHSKRRYLTYLDRYGTYTLIIITLVARHQDENGRQHCALLPTYFKVLNLNFRIYAILLSSKFGWQ